MIFWLSSGKIDALTRPSIIILLAILMLSGSLRPLVVPDEVQHHGRCHRPQALGYALCDGDTGPIFLRLGVELPMAFDVVEQAVEVRAAYPVQSASRSKRKIVAVLVVSRGRCWWRWFGRRRRWRWRRRCWCRCGLGLRQRPEIKALARLYETASQRLH